MKLADKHKSPQKEKSEIGRITPKKGDRWCYFCSLIALYVALLMQLIYLIALNNLITASCPR